MDTINVTVDGTHLGVTYSRFPAGEEYVCFTQDAIDDISQSGTHDVYVEINDASSETIMKAILVADALKQLKMDIRVIAYFGYYPYGRQDRVCKEGESFSLKVFIDMLLLRFDDVSYVDPHSDVTDTLLGYSGFPRDVDFNYIDTKTGEVFYLSNLRETPIIVPDKGAIMRSAKMNALLNPTNQQKMLRCDKVRSEDGISITMSPDDIGYLMENDEYVIFDDIGDGNFTFIVLAKEVKRLNPNVKLTLVLSHGIFSKGLKIVYEEFENVYVLDTQYNRNRLDMMKDK
jgi:ribose-phosphate pyrophosphokinase